MNKFSTVPTLAALAVISVLAGCGRSQDTTPPTTTSSSTTMMPPAGTASSSSSTTTPTYGTATTPGSTAPGTSSTGSSGSGGTSSSSSSTTPDPGVGSTGTSGSSSTDSTGTGSSTTTTTGSGRTSLLDTPDARLAASDAATLRQFYGVELTKVADTVADTSGKLSRSDRSFIKDAAVDGMYQVEAAQIAARQASDPDIKAFAEKLVKDHSAANEELKKLASSRNVEIDDKLPMMKRHSINSLNKESGPGFDHDFITKAGVKDHQSDIKKFEKASRSANDPEVRAWAEKILPTLREHLTMAQNLANGSSRGSSSAMGGSASTSGSASDSSSGMSGSSSTKTP